MTSAPPFHLDLCFKRKLVRQALDTSSWPVVPVEFMAAGWRIYNTRWLTDPATYLVVSQVTTLPTSRERFSDVPSGVSWDAHQLRFTRFISSGPLPTTVVRLRGPDESTYGDQLEILEGMPGLEGDWGSEFDVYALSCLRQHETRPAWYIIDSQSKADPVGRWPVSQVWLYVPPKSPDFVKARVTPLGLHLPLEPVVYDSEDEAALTPALLDLWSSQEEMHRDVAVSLESGGTLERARAALACYRTQLAGLPQLIGSLKQVTWAVSLREQLIERLKVERRTDAAWTKAIAAELQYADEAKDWINHRFDLMSWLDKRAASREELSPEIQSFLK